MVMPRKDVFVAADTMRSPIFLDLILNCHVFKKSRVLPPSAYRCCSCCHIDTNTLSKHRLEHVHYPGKFLNKYGRIYICDSVAKPLMRKPLERSQWAAILWRARHYTRHGEDLIGE